MTVFISYAFQDEATVDRLVSTLSRHGIDTWAAHHQIMPGDNWAEKYGEALESADAVVLMISSTSTDKGNLSNDIEYAFSKRKFKNRLIPVFLDGPSNLDLEGLPWALQHIESVNLNDYASEKKGFEAVAQRLKNEMTTI